MHGQKFAGVVLVILGSVFLLTYLTGGEFNLGQWWPLLPIAAGVASLASGNWKGGLIVIAFFTAFQLHNLGLLDLDFSALWPVLIIVIGLALLFGRRPFAGIPSVNVGEMLNVSSIFSGSSQNATGKGFTGGNVSATFGSAEVDLTSADIVDGIATINASVLFGSVSLRVPRDWAVDIQSSVMFGSIETKRPEPSEPKARLVVTGSCWFGEIQVTS